MLYDMTIPTFRNGLAALSAQLDKALIWATENGMAEGEFVTARLAPDMFPLATQVRFSCTQAAQAATRLGATDAPNLPDDAADVAGLQAQIAATQAWLAAIDPATFGDDTARTISFDLPTGMVFDMSAADYVRDWALPQYYFHLVAAYAVLRHKGAPLGKADFASYMLPYIRPGTMPGTA